jgi:hypothetical protein
MIFDEHTEYLLCTVQAGGRELYNGFDVTQAWNTMLEATNTQDAVTLIVKQMNSSQARSVTYGQKQRNKTCQHKNGAGATGYAYRTPKPPGAARYTDRSM